MYVMKGQEQYPPGHWSATSCWLAQRPGSKYLLTMYEDSVAACDVIDCGIVVAGHD